MLIPPLAVSPILQQAAEIKIEELSKARQSFQSRYHDNPAITSAGDTLKRVTALLEEITKLDPYLEHDDDLPILTRYIEQAKNDRSVSETKLQKFEQQLLDKLHKHANRLEVSSLHVELIQEAIRSNDSPESVAAKLDKAALDDEFEMVESGLEEIFENFEANTFSAKDVEVDALEEYLNSLFQDDGPKAALSMLQEDMKDYGNDVIDGKVTVEEEVIGYCMVDLAKNSLLSDERRKKLQEYIQTPNAGRELLDTLNMKSIRHWNWKTPEKGLPVTARQDSDGQYCIAIDEDIIDMLFLHTIAIGWAIKLKECLKRDVVGSYHVFNHSAPLRIEELDKREYYLLGPRRVPKPKPAPCTACHPHGVPMPLPPPRVVNVGPPPPPVALPPPASSMPHVRRVKPTRFPVAPPPPPPPTMWGSSVNEERHSNYINDFFLWRLPTLENSLPQVTSAEETQASLLKTLVAGAKLREAFDGSVHTVHAKLHDFASRLPHKTILTVLKFLGVPPIFLDVFTRFLEAKLNIGPAVRGAPDRVLTRACGVPVGHGMELFFSEAVLFFLDLAVNQKTKSYAYRLKDQFYFVGTHEQSERAIEETGRFAKAMGINYMATNSLAREPIGCLTLDLSIDKKWAFSIDMDKVGTYARRVKKQLAACDSVYKWVRVWNELVGEYAGHLFGPLANVFGQAHLEAVTRAYNHMHEIIFDGSNLTAHVKKLLAKHLGRPLEDPPFALEPLIFFPQAYGGLGVKNPYIKLNLARDMPENPDKEFEEYREEEDEYYDRATECFNNLTAEDRAQKVTTIFNNSKERIDATFGPDVDLNVFISKEGLLADRERHAQLPFLFNPTPPAIGQPWPVLRIPSLVSRYRSLLLETVDPPHRNEQIFDMLRGLSGKRGMKSWWRMSDDERWVMQMYGEDCIERYGTLEMWHGESVPLEVLKVVRGYHYEDDDDTSTVSSGSFA